MPAATWRQDGHWPQPWFAHSSAAANARAATDRPEPGGPVNSQACVIAERGLGGRRGRGTGRCSGELGDDGLLANQVAEHGCSGPSGGLRAVAGAGAERRAVGRLASHSRTTGMLPVFSSVANGTGSGSSSRIRSWISRLIVGRGPGRVQHQVALGLGVGQGAGTRPRTRWWNSAGSASSRSADRSRRPRPATGDRSSRIVRSGDQPAGRPLVEVGDLAHRQPAAGALVGQGGVHVAVGDHDRAALQRRADHRRHVLGPVRGVHERLGPRRQAGVRGVEQQRAQPHADLGRAGLVRRHHVVALLAQPDREQPGLGRLARALAALEREQHAPQRPGARARARCGSRAPAPG